MKGFNCKIAGNKAKNLEKNEAKKDINDSLASLSKATKKEVAIILDGRSRCTLKTLLKAGWNKYDIYIPNFSEDYKTIKRCHTNTFNISLLDFLNLNLSNQHKIDLIYMDYMCSLNSNDDVQPLVDIKTLFSNQMLAHNSVLGLTISIARGKKNPTPFTNLDCLTAIETVKEIATKYGYEPKLILPCGVYKNGGVMCSLIWVIK